MRVPGEQDVFAGGLARIREQFQVPGRVPGRGRGGGGRGGGQAARSASTSTGPTSSSSPSTRPRRPTSTRRSRSSATAATSCCTTPSPTSAGSSPRATRSIVEAWSARRDRVPARRQGVAVPAPSVGRCREPAARRTSAGGRVRRAHRDRRRGRARRRRAGRDPQSGQAGLRRPCARTSCRTASPSSRSASSAAEAAAGRAAGRVPRAGGGARRRRDVAARHPTPPGERGPQRRDVAGHQPGRRRRAARRRHRPVPGDAGADRAGDRPPPAHGAGLRPVVAGRARPRSSSSARLPVDDRRTDAFLLAVRRASGGASLRAVTSPAPARGTRRWRPRTPTPPPRCDGWPTGTWSRPRSPSPTAPPCPTTWPPRSSSSRPRWTRARRWPTASTPPSSTSPRRSLLSDRVGETFDGVVVDEDDRGALVQLTEPAVLARVAAHRVDPGRRGAGPGRVRRRRFEPARCVCAGSADRPPASGVEAVDGAVRGRGRRRCRRGRRRRRWAARRRSVRVDAAPGGRSRRGRRSPRAPTPCSAQ